MEIKLEGIVKNTVTAKITVTAKEVGQEQQHVLTGLAKDTTVKGFRKGNAPLNLVKDALDPEKLKQRTIMHLLDHAVIKAIEENKLKIVGNPLLLESNTAQENWGFSLSFPLYPSLELGEYKAKITSAVKKAKLKDEASKPENEDKKIKVVFDTLLDSISFDVPQALIDEEVNHALSRLVRQTETLNLTVDDYLKSLKKTPEQLKEEYQKTAVESLKLDFILIAVAKDQKLEVTEVEIKKFQETAAVGDDQQSMLKGVLLKRKAVDFLMKL